MKHHEVTARWLERLPRSRTAKCASCNRKLRPGQHTLTHTARTPGISPIRLDFHVSCIRRLIQNIPEDAVEPTNIDAAFAATRRQLKREARAA